MNTIISIIKQNIEDYSDKPILKYKEKAKFKDITWRELNKTVRLTTCALLDMGVRIGDRIAILSENRPEWVYADLAILSCNAVTIPIYTSNTAKDIEYILKDSGAEIIFVSTYDGLQKVLSIAGDTSLKRIISFKEKPSPDPLVTEFKDLLSAGKEKLQAYSSVLDQRAKSVGPDDVVTIIYTSGSTGPPKGVMLTNRNFVSNCRASSEAIGISQRDRYLSFLPLSHVFERMGGYYMFLINASQIAYTQSRDTILDDAKRLSPTLIYGVPRFFEKVYAQILNKAIGGSRIKKNIFFWGYRIGRACMLRRIRKRRVPFYLAAQKLIITNRISKKLKKSFGGRLRFFVSGGAPLSKEIAYFFLSFDILILEGYGLTESSPVIAVNRADNYKIGTVGLPVPGVTVKIAPDGEIMAKGPNIMKGYYHLYKDTESTVKDGWLYTGDIGHLDKDGFLVVTDRKKDIIVTSGGKNVSPSEVETHIKADRYIEDILIYGDKKKYLSALVIPDFENLKKYADFKKIRSKEIKELVEDESVRDFIRRRIEEKEKDLPPFARVKKFIILDKKLTQDHGELTPTLKIKRREVTAKYKDLLDSLYEDDIK
ncbi:MAG: long-chain fatty acid--CoA ligase [Candidatus Omnitrophica bacterium]|nr:long-chain fatty acid--CoA ligase [Candidatus Omnitrophota bacterium]